MTRESRAGIVKTGLSIDDAFAEIAARLAPRPPLELPVEDALGHVLSEPPRAPVDRPPFDRSAMDGYAVRAADTAAASDRSPVRLRVAFECAAGRDAAGDVGPGEAARIFTGAPLPRGADAVVRQERVVRDGDAISVSGTIPPWNDVRRRAEEAPAGDPVGRRGVRLGAGAVAALTDAGVGRVTVFPRSRVSGLVTGEELIPAGRPLPPGRVHDVNGPLLRAWLAATARSPAHVEYVGDDRRGTRDALDRLLGEAGLVVTTGGVSVGDHDHVIAAARDAGVDPVFWRVLQKPGGPLFFGVRGGAALLGLPGNPASVFCGLATVARRALDALDGATPPGPHVHPGVAGAPMPRTARRDSWVRARVETSGERAPLLVPLAGQASHMLSNLPECDAIVRVPAGEDDLPAGSPVAWIPVPF